MTAPTCDIPRHHLPTDRSPWRLTRHPTWRTQVRWKVEWRRRRRPSGGAHPVEAMTSQRREMVGGTACFGSQAKTMIRHVQIEVQHAMVGSGQHWGQIYAAFFGLLYWMVETFIVPSSCVSQKLGPWIPVCDRRRYRSTQLKKENRLPLCGFA